MNREIGLSAISIEGVQFAPSNVIIERSPTSRRLAFPRHEDPRFRSLSPEVLRHAAGLGPATSPNAVVNGRYSLLVAARDDPEKAWNHVHQSADALKEAEDLAAMAVTRVVFVAKDLYVFNPEGHVRAFFLCAFHMLFPSPLSLTAALPCGVKSGDIRRGPRALNYGK